MDDDNENCDGSSSISVKSISDVVAISIDEVAEWRVDVEFQEVLEFAETISSFVLPDCCVCD